MKNKKILQNYSIYDTEIKQKQILHLLAVVWLGKAMGQNL